MPTVANDPKNRPHPPPPPPDIGDGPNIPKGNRKAARSSVQRDMIGASGVGHQGLQRPDYRRTLERGPGSQYTHGPHVNYPQGAQPYMGGDYPPSSNQPGGSHHPLGGPAPGFGPPNYPVAGGAPPLRPNPAAPGPFPSGYSGGYKHSGALVKNWRKFVMNQKVQVNVMGNGWLVGFVVAVLQGLGMVTNSPVTVRYNMDHDRQREDTFENHPDYIRPYPDEY